MSVKFPFFFWGGGGGLGFGGGGSADFIFMGARIFLILEGVLRREVLGGHRRQKHAFRESRTALARALRGPAAILFHIARCPDLPFLGVLLFLGVLETPRKFLGVSSVSAAFLGFSRVFTVLERGPKILGVLDGFPWCLPKHQGMEDQGTCSDSIAKLFRACFFRKV